ncbi:TonB-dependent receptor [Labilibacter marinus]|uniref:TonB-dependent receptor n=1 Tax=Labilibacter marinus TaxID=1477105 RepID=UPI0008312743|nr:TonB-dependent receptor [Labilibacter marinus]
MNRIQLLALLLFINYGLLAQTKNDSIAIISNDTVPTLNHRFISEVTVQSPIRIMAKENWSGGYTRLSGSQLKQGNAYNLQEQLNTVPGVMMQQGTMSTNRITIRGIGSRTPYQTNRIKAYWGEMPLTDGDGATSIEDIGLNDMTSLQVIKGSASALYGAGMGGAILISPWNNNNIVSGVHLKSEYGSYNTFSQHAQVNWRGTKNGRYSWTGGALLSDGYRDNANYKRYNSTFKGERKIGHHYLRFLYNYRYLNGEIPSSLDSIDFNDNPHKAASSWENIGGYEKGGRHMASIGLISPLGNQSSNTLSVFGKLSNLDELRPFNQLKEDKYSWGLRNRLESSICRVSTTVGAELMLENNNQHLYAVKADNIGEQLSSAEHHRYYYNIFGMAHVNPVNGLRVNVALNYNQTGYKLLDEGFSYQYSPVWSPRLGLNYKLSERTNVYASAGHGFSAPSLEEAQLPDGSFNPTIKPEEGWNYEAGFRLSNIGRRLFGDVTFYLMKMNNLLVTERDADDQFYGKNAGKTTHKGMETSMSYKLTSFNDPHDLVFTLAYFISENKFNEFVDNGVSYDGKHLPGIPASNWSIDINGSYKSFSYYLGHKYYGKQYLNDANTKQYQSYHKTNAKIAYGIQAKKMEWNIYLGADNLFNTHYASMVLVNAKAFGNSLPRYYYPGLPFNMFGGLEWRF